MIFKKDFGNRSFLVGSKTINTRRWLGLNSREIFWNQPTLCAHVFRFLTLKQWLKLRRLNTNCCTVVDHLLSVRFHQQCNEVQVVFSSIIPKSEPKFQPQNNKRFEVSTEEILYDCGMRKFNLELDKKTSSYLLLKTSKNYVRCDANGRFTDQIMGHMRKQLEKSFYDLWSTPLKFLIDDRNNKTSSNESKKAYLLSRHLIFKAIEHLFAMYEKPVKSVLAILSDQTKDNIHWKFIQCLSEETPNIHELKRNRARPFSQASGWLSIASYLINLPDSFIKYCARTSVTQCESSWDTLKLLFNWIRSLMDYNLLILRIPYSNNPQVLALCSASIRVLCTQIRKRRYM